MNMPKWTLSIVILLTLLPHNSNSASLNGFLNKPRRHKGSRRQLQPPYYNTLPLKPSGLLLPLDLEESPNPDLDPDLDHLNDYELLDIMGEDYDRQFMSLREPLDMKRNPNGTLFYKFRKNQTPKDEEMPLEIQRLSQRSIKLADDGIELRVKFSRRTKQKLQKFLWSYSYCPVRYKWKELSTRFWPRWIKVGSCDNQRSCSIPAGMTCQPSKRRNIRILRYYCPIQGSKRSCQWVKLEYPILSECSCSCRPER